MIELLPRLKKALESLPISEIKILYFEEATYKYATVLVISKLFGEDNLKSSLNMIYNELDSKDCYLRVQIDLTFVILSPEQLKTIKNL